MQNLRKLAAFVNKQTNVSTIKIKTLTQKPIISYFIKLQQTKVQLQLDNETK